MMGGTSHGQDRRPQHVAAFGFLLQLAVFVVLLGLSIWSQSDVLQAAARFAVIGVPIWAVLFFVFKQITRVRAEALEVTELQRARAAGATEAIFEMDEETLYLERNRLLWLVRWVLPFTSILLTVLLLGGHFVGWSWSLEQAFSSVEEGAVRRAKHPTMDMWIVVFAGFLSFLYARYSVALARLPEWRMLRSGALCMAGNALVCLILVFALMLSSSLEWSEPLAAYVVRVTLVILGIEFLANFVLDLYRPRATGIVPRPSFESRLLGLASEPGNVARSIAEAVNYQFGFEVSSTWFYQLLQRWLFPIVVFTAFIVMMLTGVVVVEADEEVVVERFGRLVGAGDEPVLGPGLHLKWPYPTDVVHRAPVRRIRELVIGESSTSDDHDVRKAVVWTEPHDFVPELMLIVAAPRAESDEDLALGGSERPNGESPSRGVAVSLLMVSVPIEYRVKSVRDFLYRYEEPLKVLEAVAYQYVSEYAAGVDVDELIGPGRDDFNRRLRTAIQNRLDDLQIGIEIVFCGVRGAHPPAESQVAQSFQAVVSAQTNRTATINAALGEAQRILTGVAGTEGRARELDAALRERDRLRATGGPAEAVDGADRRVDDLILGNREAGIAPLSGSAAALIAEGRSRASRMVSTAQAKSRGFATEVAGYLAAPTLYRKRKVLEVFEVMEHVRKYLVVGDSRNVLIEYQVSEPGGLDRVLSEGSQKKK